MGHQRDGRAVQVGRSGQTKSRHLTRYLVCFFKTGASASTLLLWNGDILGFSGLISTTGLNVQQTRQDVTNHWKLVWLATFMLTVNFYINHVEDANRDPRLETKEVAVASTAAHLLGGFLVGLGTKLANGCTSGHGVCGIARFSKRSLVAVPIFTLCSMMTTAALNAPQFEAFSAIFRTEALPIYSKLLGTLATAAVVALGLLRRTHAPVDGKDTAVTTTPADHDASQKKLYGAAISAVLAAIGLIVSGMTKKSKVNDFLDLCALCRSGGKMDPTLVTVLGSAILSSWLGYQFVHGWNTLQHGVVQTQPIAGGKFSIPTNTNIDGQLVGGAVLFGVGWGMTSLCPGPALYHAAAGMSDVLLAWFPAFFTGSWTGVQLKEHLAKKKTA